MQFKKRPTVRSRELSGLERQTPGPVIELALTPTFVESTPPPKSKEYQLTSDKLTLKFTDNLTTRYTQHKTVEPVELIDQNLIKLDEKTNQHRITLLSRKYARKSLSQEESARLNMLTERLRNLVPEITESEVAHMEHLSNVLEKAAQSAQEIADEHNITL
ncbi:MAG: hypothetical protein AB2776_20665 [Candidatus Thiodiazotropha endolucinida]